MALINSTPSEDAQVLSKKEASKQVHWELWLAGDARPPIIYMVKKSVPYKAGGKKCNLCLWEKLLIMQNEEEVINKRDEFVNKCRHAPKFLLGNIKDRGRTEGDIT